MTDTRKSTRGVAGAESRDRPFTLGPRAVLLVLLPASQLLPLVAGLRPDWVELGYAHGLYPYLSSGLRVVSDLVPFSIAEVSLVLLAGLAAWASFRGAAEVIRGVRRPGNALGHGVLNLLAVAGLCAGGWLVLWGLNYQRPTFAELSGLEPAAPRADGLGDLCASLVDRARRVAEEAPVAEDGTMDLPQGRADALERVGAGLSVAAETFPVLEWNYARPKQAMLSPVLSLLGIRGIYSPLTGEPHVNAEITDSELPFAAAHEVAHQVGFAREDEANVIAALACLSHPDADFRYSGLLEVLPPLLAALAELDPERYAELSERIPARMRLDWKNSLEKWRERDSPVRHVARSVNDVYLKAQGEAEGVKSYGEVVELLLVALAVMPLP